MIAAAAALLALGLSAGPVDLEEAKKAGAAAAESWVALVDGGKYPEAWKEAADLFKSGVTSEEGTKKLKGARDPLGAVGARKLQSARYTEVLPSAPDGRYVVATYVTDFANKKGATELIAVAQEPDGKWKVSAYAVQ